MTGRGGDGGVVLNGLFEVAWSLRICLLWTRVEVDGAVWRNLLLLLSVGVTHNEKYEKYFLIPDRSLLPSLRILF